MLITRPLLPLLENNGQILAKVTSLLDVPPQLLKAILSLWKEKEDIKYIIVMQLGYYYDG